MFTYKAGYSFESKVISSRMSLAARLPTNVSAVINSTCLTQTHTELTCVAVAQADVRPAVLRYI